VSARYARVGWRPLAAMLLAAVAPACEDTTTSTVDQLNLERPVDVAFACYGGLRLTGGGAGSPDDEIITTAMPREACAIRSRPVPEAEGDLPNVPEGQESLIDEGGLSIPSVAYQAFILQSVPGTVAVAGVPTKPAIEFSSGDVVVNDADPLTPGKNSISVGSLPVAIAIDRDGCYAATANAGSCDLSVFSVNSALSAEESPVVNRVPVVNADGEPLLARPAAMLGQPSGGVIGVACEPEPTGVMYVAYPGCHLVAAVEPATGEVVASVRFATDGSATITDGAVTCPAECGGLEPRTEGPRPGAIDLAVDDRVGSRRLVIGSDNAAELTVVDLDEDGLFASLTQVVLEGDVGVLDVALSPQIGMGGEGGELNDDTAAGGQFQFVYAVATDGTVRVADVLAGQHECDTQVDPRELRGQADVGFLSCMPVGDANTPPRRAGARGPGVQLPGEGVAQSVAIVPVDTYAADDRFQDPEKLVGYFAIIGATSGAVFVVNIDDDDYPDFLPDDQYVSVSVPLAIAHQLRDNVPNRNLVAETVDDAGDVVAFCGTDGPDPDDATTNAGGPRATEPPRQIINRGFLSPDKAGMTAHLRDVRCDDFDGATPVSELQFAAPVQVRDEVFPDMGALTSDENWQLSWEGSLSLDSSSEAIDGPPVRTAFITAGGLGVRVLDEAAPFCGAGVEVGDVVTLVGCDPVDGDVDCPIGFECYSHPDSEVAAGSCLPKDDLAVLSSACRDFLVSARQYSVAEVSADELRLAPRPVVLRTTPVTGCESATQCQELDAVAQRLASSEHPEDDTTEIVERAWACEPEPSRPGDIDRCVLMCEEDADCGAGAVCDGGGRCIEGAVPPLQCITGRQDYTLHASDAFVVVGERSGYIHPWIADEDGACVIDPSASPRQRGRIPLTAAPCAGATPSPADPNPCQLETETFEPTLSFDAACEATEGEPAARATTGVRLQTPGLTLTMVDLTYPGDAVCIGDREGDLVGVPTVHPGLSFDFRQVNGRAPLALRLGSAGATLPSRIVRGPQDSIWVVDEGDYLSTSATTASTRGKVFRIEGQELATVNVLQ
jgi:hypothetical protein